MSDAWYIRYVSRIREIILERLDELGRSRYWLAKKAAERGIVGNRETVLRFLRGERDTSSTVISGLLTALDLEIRSTRRKGAK